MSFEWITQEYEKHGRISRRSTEILKAEILGDNPYAAITVAGDCAAFEIGQEIGHALSSDDSMVRWNAVGVLFTRFRDPTLADKCLALATCDSDEMVRSIALCGVGEVLDRVKDIALRLRMSETLVETLDNDKELSELRQSAYEGILAAMDVLPVDRPAADCLLMLDAEIDRDLVDKFRERYLEEAATRH